MSERAKKVLEEARLLPVEERREVVEAILEMDMEDDDDVVEDPAEVARAWEIEIKKRVQGIVDGTAELIDEDVVRAELNRRRMRKSA
jgi:Putative addiction module component